MVCFDVLCYIRRENGGGGRGHGGEAEEAYSGLLFTFLFPPIKDFEGIEGTWCRHFLYYFVGE